MHAWPKFICACELKISWMSTRSSFYIFITNFVMADVYLPRHQEVGKVESEPEEIVDIKEKRLSFRSGAKPLRMIAT